MCVHVSFTGQTGQQPPGGQRRKRRHGAASAAVSAPPVHLAQRISGVSCPRDRRGAGAGAPPCFSGEEAGPPFPALAPRAVISLLSEPKAAGSEVPEVRHLPRAPLLQSAGAGEARRPTGAGLAQASCARVLGSRAEPTLSVPPQT